MKNRRLFYIILVISILAITGLCLLVYMSRISPIETLGQTKIQSDRNTYAPFMSTTVGIG
jgi:hypothetical protein